VTAQSNAAAGKITAKIDHNEKSLVMEIATGDPDPSRNV
jgi:hypothetical protein